MESKALKNLLQKIRCLFIFKTSEPKPGPWAERKPTMSKSSQHILTNPDDVAALKALAEIFGEEVAYDFSIPGQAVVSEDERSVTVEKGRLTGLYLMNGSWKASLKIDLSVLGKLTALTTLNLKGNEISDLSPFASGGLTALTDLDLSYNKISDLAPLAGLTALTSLDLCVNDDICDLGPLAGLTKLTSLNLQYSSIFDLRPQSGLNDIGRLRDISPLANLTSLNFLCLAGNMISDLSPLAKLTALKYLDLSGNKINDLSPLAKLTALENLDLYGNPISDLTPLAGLTSLTRLNIRDTLVTDYTPLMEIIENGDLFKKLKVNDDDQPVLTLTVSSDFPIKFKEKLEKYGLTVEVPRSVAVPVEDIDQALENIFKEMGMEGNQDDEIIFLDDEEETGKTTNGTESGTRLRFWRAVSDGLAEQIGLKTQTPKDRPYLEVSLGRTGFFLSNVLYQSGAMAARLMLNGEGKDELFKSLLADRNKIERNLGTALTWSGPDEAKKNISLIGPALNLDDEADFAPAVAWMVEWIAKLKATFEPRVKNFNPSGRGKETNHE